MVLDMTQQFPGGGGWSSIGGNGNAYALNVTSVPTKATWPYVQQWSLSVQHEFPGQTLATVAYVGSKGTHLTLERQINQLQPLPASQNPYAAGQPMTASDCNWNGQYFNLSNGATITPNQPAFTNMMVACGIFTGNSLREAYPGMGQIFSVENTANSSYNAFQVTLRHSIHSLTLGVAYTYSHSIDDSSDRSDSTYVNSYDLAANRASSNFDQRHLLHVSYVYDLPKFSEGSRFLRGALNHWQWSGITIFETGIPFSIINNGSNANGIAALDNAGVANGTGAGSYADRCGDPYGSKPSGGSNSGTFGPLLLNPGAFCAPQGLTFGNSGRNSVRNPFRWNFDTALMKHITLPNESNLEFRVEAFNVFNNTQFEIYDPDLGNQPNNTVSCYGNAASGYSGAGNGGSCLGGSSFLHPIEAHRPRTLQLALKYSF
jgi:hypothetical protein